MFLQVASSLESGLAAQQNQDTTSIEGLAAKLDAMTGAMEALSSEVVQLRAAVAASTRGTADLPVGVSRGAPPDAMQTVRKDILAHLQQQQYEAAFTKALSASAADMAVYCCKHANVSDVLGGNSPALSQPILLCLMQQLGAVLVSSTGADLQANLEWLQELALSLDPQDESIHRHVPAVLQQLVASIEEKMAQGDPSLRRPLQMLLQVIRGMQR
jgi:enhancer of mRNA-decapping protein 4